MSDEELNSRDDTPEGLQTGQSRYADAPQVVPTEGGMIEEVPPGSPYAVDDRADEVDAETPLDDPHANQATYPIATPEVAEGRNPEPLPIGVQGSSYSPAYGSAEDPVAPQPRRGLSTGSVVTIAVLCALIFGAVAGGMAGFAGAWMATRGGDGVLASDGSRGGSTVRVLPSETDEPVVAATAAALPAIVNIDVSGDGEATGGEGGLPEGHPGVPVQGNGSGVAYKSEDGVTYVITNAHVVEGADNIIVTGVDRERHRATLVGADEETDIAVVKIDAEMSTIQVGESNDLQVGQLVVAIGSPYGLEQSVSMGVVSALGRSLPDSATSNEGVYPLVDVIQTDAAINPGNSGGALVDREGRLVGINSAIYSDTGSNGGIGFAITSDTAVSVAEQLMEDGSVDHPFLGILGRDVDEALAEEEGIPVEEGAFVVEVTADTNAEKAGIKANDVIVALDDSDIRSMDDLILEVRRRDVGDVVTITLYRDGEKQEIEMTVGAKPKNLEIPEEPVSPSPNETESVAP